MDDKKLQPLLEKLQEHYDEWVHDCDAFNEAPGSFEWYLESVVEHGIFVDNEEELVAAAKILLAQTEPARPHHPTYVPGWEGSLEELAQAVENLRYDKVSDFLYHLNMALQARSQSDTQAGKPQLSSFLIQASHKIASAALDIERAWIICKPHMITKGTDDTHE